MPQINSISTINGFLISASYASYAATASFLTAGTYNITASQAINSQTASFLPAGTYNITASQAINSQTASFLPAGTYNITSSWANNARTASIATSATTATYAARIDVDLNTSNPGVTYYIPFVAGIGNGINAQSLQIDSASNAGMQYNPGTDSVTVAKLVGTASLAATASSITALTQNVSITGSTSILGSTNIAGTLTVSGSTQRFGPGGITTFTTNTVNIDPNSSGTNLVSIRDGSNGTSRIVSLGLINGGSAPDIINVVGGFSVSPASQRVSIIGNNGGWFEIDTNGNTKLGDDILKTVAITGSVNVVGSLNMQNSTVNLSVGSSTRAPITFTPTSSLMTTITAGAMEYNGIAFYAAPTASARAVIATEHFCCSTSPWTLTNTVSLQKVFGTDVSANGALSVAAADTYFFECCLNISGMSGGVSGNMGFSILGAGTATLTSAAWHAFGYDATTQSTAGAIGGSFSSTGAATGNIVTATTGTALSVFIKGIFRVNAAGTIIPSLQLTTAIGTAVVGVNSWFKCYPIGSNTVTAIGPWS